MKLVERKNIDSEKWDAAVSASQTENIFMYSGYVEVVSPGWSALISGNYKTILPVPFTKKLKVRQFYQAQFTREYDVLGDDFTIKQACEYLSENFSSVHFRNGEKGILKGGKKRTHQLLNLQSDFTKNYSTNAKRILKKSSAYRAERSDNPEILITLFKVHVAHKIETLSKKRCGHSGATHEQTDLNQPGVNSFL
ncbi:MAG: hypothetical protein IPM77_06815 [Crocinitomicaceae bacterium]|nr:hypothetical protein [Crocinitomicaceae bacterium]